MRIDKLLELENFGSKRHVKKLIKSGQVIVEGEVISHENQNVDPWLQTIVIAGKRIQRKTHVYYMLNKPQGVVTATKDKHHTTVLDLIEPKDRKEGIYPVERLDRDTEGLLLLTDNGQLGYQLLHPYKKVAKCYEVIVNDFLSHEDIARFKEGIIFSDGSQCQPADLVIRQATKEKSHASLEITEGKFHQVKKMFLSVGKKVIFLKRKSMGPIQLDPYLPTGKYRELTKTECKQLLPYFTYHEK